MHGMAWTHARAHAAWYLGPILTQPEQLTARDSDPTQHSIMKLPHAIMLRKSEKKPPAVGPPAGQPASAGQYG